MKVLICIDSFKGTISSLESGKIVSEILASKNIQSKVLAISDGGEGMIEALEYSINAQKVLLEVNDPLKRKIKAKYLIKDEIAYIEMAQSSGIIHLKRDELNPFITTSYGLGEQILDAIKRNVKEIVLGIGGSATNDCGIGMLSALGVEFYNFNDELFVPECNNDLPLIKSFDIEYLNDLIKNIKFTLVCDVKNPLLGFNGATYVYSKQKGATKENMPVLENNILHFAKLINIKTANNPGSGAAGGVGYAMLNILKANFYQGIDYILDIVAFDNYVKYCDLVITGEGFFDKQSLNGKVPVGIAKRTQEYNKNVIVVCALTDVLEVDYQRYGIRDVHAIIPKVASKEASLNEPIKYFTKLIESIDFIKYEEMKR